MHETPTTYSPITCCSKTHFPKSVKAAYSPVSSSLNYDGRERERVSHQEEQTEKHRE